MKKKIKQNRLTIGLVFLLFFLGNSVWAQKVIIPKEKASPLRMISFLSSDNTYLKVTYGSPFKKGREIFGNLVPFGEIWRTGANEATEFTTTQDLKIGGEILKAGTYTVFTVPGEKNWEVIFNSTLGQWGAYRYEDNKSFNVLKAEAKVAQSKEFIYEAFTIQFEETRKGVDLVFAWDQ
ncbi:MAG: DUF2911 domain-containing protein, partial [Bacteroidota bacterium]